jgi:transcriptional regulator with XRE-family HTH domain
MRVSLATMKQRDVEGFGQRLAEIRKSRGMTQAELGDAVGVSNRVIAYYELESTQPPGAMLVDLSRALHVTTDELLGASPVRERVRPKTARLMKRLQRVADLPPTDQKAVLKFIDALVQSRGITAADRRHNTRNRASR